MIPYTIQGVILSVSILVLYAKNGTLLSDRMVMLVGAYCIIILPHIYNGIRNGMRAINMNMLLEAAEMLGDSKGNLFLNSIAALMDLLLALLISQGCYFVFFVTLFLNHKGSI